MKTTTASTMQLAHREILLIWAIFLLLMLALSGRELMGRWHSISGAEFEWIAQSLADGQGYSFPGTHRWLFRDESAPGSYHPTAWLPPVYPLFMGACFKVLGEHGRIIIGGLQVLAFIATAALLYPLGRRVFGNPWTGLLAGSALAVMPTPSYTILRELSNAAVAGLLVVVTALTMLWCVQRISVRRGLVLGAVLALAVQTHASTVLFCPLAVLVVLLVARFRARGWVTVVVVTATCTALMTPWIVRNAVVFGEMVPTRTGLGFNTYLCNNVIAESSRPDLPLCEGPPPWTADGDMDAILTIRDHAFLTPSLTRAFACFAQSEPPGFQEMNEPQRDRAYLHAFGEFVKAEPGVVIALTVKKTLAFYGGTRPGGYSGWGGGKLLIATVALLGIIVGARRPGVWLLVAMLAAYTLPYALGLPYYYRYRYPVEPLLILLACHFVVVCATLGYDVLCRSRIGGRLLQIDRSDA